MRDHSKDHAVAVAAPGDTFTALPIHHFAGRHSGRAGLIVCSDAPEFYGRGAWECEATGKTRDSGGYETEAGTRLYYAYFRLDDGTRWEVFHSGTVVRDRDVTIDVWYDFDKGRGGAGSRP